MSISGSNYMSGEDKITSWFAEKSDAPADMFPIGIGDDMAQIAAPGGSLLVTTDMLLDGTHFDLASAGFEQAGYKAMAASLSDCAAMASVPVCAVCAVALAEGTTQDDLKLLHDGIRRAGDEFSCYLIGGDITSWKGDGRFAVNITMLSRPSEKCAPVRRNGAKPGDVICVTGTLGGAISGKHLTFTPRVREALAIAGIAKINSMMDISDGISTDLKRICDQSGVGAMLNESLLPLSDAALQCGDPTAAALNDGEDFELLFTLSESEYEKLIAAWVMETPINRVGLINETSRLKIKRKDGNIEDIAPSGYDHL